MECDTTAIDDAVKNTMQDSLVLDEECRKLVLPQENRDIIDLTGLSDDELEDYPAHVRMEEEEDPELRFKSEGPQAGEYHLLPCSHHLTRLRVVDLQVLDFHMIGSAPLLDPLSYKTFVLNPRLQRLQRFTGTKRSSRRWSACSPHALQ